jgi:hypothetical protein
MDPRSKHAERIVQRHLRISDAVPEEYTVQECADPCLTRFWSLSDNETERSVDKATKSTWKQLVKESGPFLLTYIIVHPSMYFNRDESEDDDEGDDEGDDE